jgi:hypothetical protein
MRSVTRFGIVVALAGVALVGSSAPSLAECVSQPNRFPDFAGVAPTARTVVIGTVVASQREDPTEATVLFSLRVDEVIRGDPPAVMDIEGLRSGLPVRGAEACRENAFLYVQVGDVVALALDGHLGRRFHINTAAWIEGGPDEWVPGVRVMTRARAIAAAEAMPPTDAAPSGSPEQPSGDLVSLVLRSLAEAWGRLLASEAPN